MSAVEAERRQKLALDAIKQAFGTETGEDNINLYVEDHLEELPESYWEQHLGAGTPEPSAVIDPLRFGSSRGEGDIESFDFAFPDEATDYVISVHFDDAGSIDGISMESCRTMPA